MRLKYICFIIAGLLPLTALAQDATVNLRIKNHRFEPDKVYVPPGKKIKLVVRNDDHGAEEFESHALGREKVIAGGRQAAILVGPLAPGSYEFFGEFHPQTARGWLIAGDEPQQPKTGSEAGNAAAATPSAGADAAAPAAAGKAEADPAMSPGDGLIAVPPLGGSN